MGHSSPHMVSCRPKLRDGNNIKNIGDRVKPLESTLFLVLIKFVFLVWYICSCLYNLLLPNGNVKQPACKIPKNVINQRLRARVDYLQHTTKQLDLCGTG